MIDREARTKAADLVRRFRDGLLTNVQLENAWPDSLTDGALRALEAMLWRLYDDHREHALVGKYALDNRDRAELTRYAAFLDTDLPYLWSGEDFFRTAGLGLLVPLSLGLLWPLDRWIKARNRRADKRLGMQGELAAWPFICAADYTADLPVPKRANHP